MKGSLFQYQDSETFQLSDPYNQFPMMYGSGSVEVFEGSDDVCLDEAQTICAWTKFGNGIKQRGLGGMHADGIVGLAPATDSYAGADLFIPTLYKQGAIDSMLYSFAIRTNDDSSRIIIGDYDLEKFAAPDSELTWHPLINPENQHWMIELNSMKLGDYVFEADLNKALMDSGTSLTLLPNKMFYALKNELSSALGIENYWEDAMGLTAFKCDEDVYSQIPSLTFNLGDREVEMSPASMVGFHERNGEQVCTLKFMHNW